MRVAIQMDDLGSIRPETDTTLLLGAEACARGHEVFIYTPDQLHLLNGRVRAHGHRAVLRNQLENYYTLSELQILDLHTMQIVLMRQDPPFDMAYVTATYLLERIMDSTLVVNNPFHVRNNPEKLFPLQFPEFLPPTLVTSQAEDIHAFHREYKDVVIKPLYGFGGHSIFRIPESGANLHALTEMLTRDAREPLVVQKFLPEVKDQERRILLVHGEFAGMLGRIPAEQEIRSNTRIGGTAVKAELTKKQHAACERLGPVMREKGLYLVGFDMIGGWLTEINITCPTGLQLVRKLYGTAPEKMFWDRVEKLSGIRH